MAMRRLRDDCTGTYYHLIARTAGCASDRPFGDAEKQKLVTLFTTMSQFYTVEIISYCVMSTHLHLVVMAPSDLPDFEETKKRFGSYYPDKTLASEGSVAYERVRERMRDISDFMKSLQMRFTCWFNRTRPEKRRGRLWGDRFKSVILQGKGASAVWSCVKYVELNAVRAGIVSNPGAYRFCSWGVFNGTGKHPFAANFLHHARRVLGNAVQRHTNKQIYSELEAELTRVLAVESGAGWDEVVAMTEAARKGTRVWDRADRRVRFWSDGAVIGSKLFVKECYARFINPQRAGKHKYGQGVTRAGDKLYSLRRLQKDV